MSVRQIMTENALTVGPTDRVETALRHLIENRYINLPVVDANGKYLGLFGVFEVMALFLPRAALLENAGVDLSFIREDAAALRERMAECKARTVADAMRRDAPVLRPETSVLEAIYLCHRTRSSLPVVEKDSDRLLGIVSYWDAIAALMSPR
jgi:CBS domain-containing protein